MPMVHSERDGNYIYIGFSGNMVYRTTIAVSAPCKNLRNILEIYFSYALKLLRLGYRFVMNVNRLPELTTHSLSEWIERGVSFLFLSLSHFLPF